MSEPQPLVFVIDDDASVRRGLAELLGSVGIGVQVFESAQEFLDSKRIDAPGCIVLDVRLRGASGLEFQNTLLKLGNPLRPIRVSLIKTPLMR